MCTSDRAWWNMEKKCARKRFCTAKCIHDSRRIINDRMEKYSSLFVFISKQHCRTALKNLLADGRGGWVADGRLCRSRVAAKISQPPYVGVEWGGGGRVGRYSPGTPSALTQIVHYLSSYYTVFHSVVYNSVMTVHSTIVILKPW